MTIEKNYLKIFICPGKIRKIEIFKIFVKNSGGQLEIMANFGNVSARQAIIVGSTCLLKPEEYFDIKKIWTNHRLVSEKNRFSTGTKIQKMPL